MAITNINDVQLDMEVIEDVLDARGNVLLKQGSVLSEVWIERLKKRDITKINVKAEGDEAVAEHSGSSGGISLEELQKQMKMIFAPVLGQPHMKALAQSTYQFLKPTAHE